MANHGVQDVKTIPIAAVVAGGIGLVVGVPALRLSGLYLALATFGIAVVFPTILKKFDHFTGGSTGITLFGKPTQTGHGNGYLWLTNDTWLYLLTWTIAVSCFLVAWWLVDSRFGRSLRAIRDSELAATASGLNRSAYKVAAFGISAAFAGVAGALLAINIAYVSPDTFPIQLSLLPARRRGRRPLRLDLGRGAGRAADRVPAGHRRADPARATPSRPARPRSSSGSCSSC